MKSKKYEVEIPENMPIITPEMMKKTAIEIAKLRAGKKESPMKVMKVSKSDKAILTPLSNRKMIIELLNSTA